MRRVQAQSVDVRSAINEQTDYQRIIANSTALDKTKGLIICDPQGANLTGLTLAAPTVDDLGRVLKVINQLGAFTAAITVTGAMFATQDVFTLAAPAANALGPCLMLECVNSTPAAAQPTPKWATMPSVGVTVA
jgi:hypothetical protein